MYINYLDMFIAVSLSSLLNVTPFHISMGHAFPFLGMSYFVVVIVEYWKF